MALIVYATGKNSEYDLGLGDATQRISFVEVGNHDWTVVRHNTYDANQFGVGIKTDGTLWGWGDNTYKQLGLPNASYTTPTQIGSDTDWADVALGDWFILARKTNGKIYACGRNVLGQCAQGNTTSPVSTLTQIGSATDWASIAAGPDNGYAIKTNGTLWGWGVNDAGQVGKGTTGGSQTTPVQEATSSTLWSAVAAGSQFAIARRSNGTLWGWGDYTWGANGLGGSSASTPTQIGSGTAWTVIATGRVTSHAIKSDGTLWSWGAGAYYSLGNGSTSTQYSPVQVGSGSVWQRVDAGYNFLLAQMTDGTLWGCGYNNNGQLGMGNTTSPITSLTQIASLPITPTSIQADGLASLISTTYTAASEQVTAPITVTVQSAPGTPTAPITVTVRAAAVVTAPIRVSVVDSLDTRAWALAVSLGGVDVTARVTGAVEVDAEEGASRVATWAMTPPSGAINPVSWTGAEVAIDLIRVIGGVSVPSRLFTGRVDEAAYDPVQRLVRFDCADDLHQTVAAMTEAEVDALTGGSYSVAAHGTLDDRWQYAQARMESRPASLDASAHGGLRVTDWDGLDIWRTFTADDILHATPGIELPRRRDMINRVDIAYEYRLHRLRQREASLSWSGSIIGTAALASGYQFPSLEAVESAVSGLGWHVVSSAWSDAYAYVASAKPTGAPDGADSDWWIYGGGGIASYAATLRQRHAQTVTERYAITVTAPDSIAANGTLSSTLRGALASAWTPNEWEASATLAPDVSAADQDYSPDADRAASDAAMEHLVAMARTKIIGSHRRARVSFAIPCLPELDLIHAVALDTETVEASGKVVRLRHVLDPDAGEATTTVSFAVSGIAATGTAADTPVVAAPPPDVDAATGEDDWGASLPTLSTHVGGWTGATVYSESMMGFLVNAPSSLRFYNFTLDAWFSADNAYYSAVDEFDVTGFRIAMPGVADTHRNPIETDQTASFDVAVPEDPFTLTA